MSSSLLKSLVVTFSILATSHILADNGQPDLWKVEKNGNTSYLFGSIHMGSEDMYPLSQEVKKAYSSTDNLVVEIDLKPGDEIKIAPLVQQYGLNLTVPLEQRLSPEGLVIFKKACQEKSLPCAQFAPYKAWLLSVQLSVMAMQQLGYKEDLGIDKHFLSQAHKANKNIISLESAELQFKMLGGFDQQQQELMLIQSLQASNDDLKALFTAWKSGDDEAMLAMFHKDLEKPGAMDMFKAMFDNRNINMANQISQYIAAKKTLFVVVGAGHIVGENGIVDLLRKEGFKLTQVQ